MRLSLQERKAQRLFSSFPSVSAIEWPILERISLPLIIFHFQTGPMRMDFFIDYGNYSARNILCNNATSRRILYINSFGPHREESKV